MKIRDILKEQNLDERNLVISPDMTINVKKLWQYINRNLVDLASMAIFEKEASNQPYVEERLSNLLKTPDGRPVTIAFDGGSSIEFKNNVLYVPIEMMYKYRHMIPGTEFVKEVLALISPQQGVAEGVDVFYNAGETANKKPVGKGTTVKSKTTGIVGKAYSWSVVKGVPYLYVKGDDDRYQSPAKDWLVVDEQDVSETMGGTKPLTVAQLATISDAALDQAYGYGRSTPGKTFGWQANLQSAAQAKKMIDAGVTDIERIADAIHRGWNVTAQKFVQDPDQFADTEKLRAAGKLDAKLDQRAKLMRINYAQLPDDEQEKDRVVARALLQALTGAK